MSMADDWFLPDDLEQSMAERAGSVCGGVGMFACGIGCVFRVVCVSVCMCAVYVFAVHVCLIPPVSVPCSVLL